ncbi:MAG: 5'-methylthioadenosine/adenosylhomocysteine nucleosidase [Odoribacteraceae bacterium]|jgi:adenosylhomocysteine nucleosidase|nr:5'-methylthioadenosine/adenosylhomocysteine nucleosidase [Odoribacteraceae bacterium]
MKRVGVIVAMREEYELARAVLACREERLVRGMRFVEGSADGVELVLVQCGIGKVCSAIGAVEMIRGYAPEIIINTGVAGGIDPSSRVMDVVVGDEVVYHDVWCGEGNAWGQVQGLPPRFRSDRGLYRLALSIVPATGRVRGGLICSGDRFITGREELDEIRGRFPGGLAVDMESGSLAQTCHLYGVPFLSYRLISDTPGVEEHAQQFRDFWTEAPARSFEMLRALIRGAANQ